MTLTAREAMQALLDGKTLISREGYTLHLEYDELRIRHGQRGQIHGVIPRTLLGLREYTEYPLTFEEALRAMLDGKVVTSECYPDFKLRFNEGIIEHMNTFLPGRGWRISRTFDRDEQESKWKVVE